MSAASFSRLCLLLMTLKTTYSYVLLTANVDDFREIIKKLVPETIVEHLVDTISRKLTKNEPELSKRTEEVRDASKSIGLNSMLQDLIHAIHVDDSEIARADERRQLREEINDASFQQRARKYKLRRQIARNNKYNGLRERAKYDDVKQSRYVNYEPRVVRENVEGKVIDDHPMQSPYDDQPKATNQNDGHEMEHIAEFPKLKNGSEVDIDNIVSTIKKRIKQKYKNVIFQNKPDEPTTIRQEMYENTERDDETMDEEITATEPTVPSRIYQTLKHRVLLAGRQKYKQRVTNKGGFKSASSNNPHALSYNNPYVLPYKNSHRPPINNPYPPNNDPDIPDHNLHTPDNNPYTPNKYPYPLNDNPDPPNNNPDPSNDNLYLPNDNPYTPHSNPYYTASITKPYFTPSLVNPNTNNPEIKKDSASLQRLHSKKNQELLKSLLGVSPKKSVKQAPPIREKPQIKDHEDYYEKDNRDNIYSEPKHINPDQSIQNTEKKRPQYAKKQPLRTFQQNKEYQNYRRPVKNVPKRPRIRKRYPEEEILTTPTTTEIDTPLTTPSNDYETVDLTKNRKDSYEHYRAPEKDSSIFESPENHTKDNNEDNKDDNEEFSDNVAETLKSYELGIKGQTESLWYDEKQAPEIEPIKKDQTVQDLDKRLNKKKKNLFTTPVTRMPTKSRYTMITPDPLKDISIVAEKYDFKEPLPEQDREPEKLDFMGDPDAKINKKIKFYE